MATTYDEKTPGVYVQEISNLPASVAQVETTIPAFIGCTQKAQNGTQYLTNIPTRITSLLEYENLFGTSLNEPLTVSWTNDPQQPIRVELTDTDKKLQQIMYYNMQMFFNNGGGECYIVSLANGDGTDNDKYIEAIKSLEKKQDITLIVLTDAAYYLDDIDKNSVYDAALDHCNTMQNRFVIFDAEDEEFRNRVGTEYLQYGAAYTPFLDTTLNYIYNDTENVSVNGVSCTFEGAQFNVTYVGENPVACFEVIEDEAIQNDVEFSVVDNSLTISFKTGQAVDNVKDAWDDYQQKGNFILAVTDGAGNDGVSEQPKVEFTGYSYFSKIEEDLFVSYRGSSLDRPTVEMEIVDGDNDALTVEILNDKLVINYEVNKTCTDLVEYMNTQDTGGFSISLVGGTQGGSTIDSLENNKLDLGSSSFHTNNVSGLQIGNVAGGAPTVVIKEEPAPLLYEEEYKPRR